MSSVLSLSETFVLRIRLKDWGVLLRVGGPMLGLQQKEGRKNDQRPAVA